MDIIEKRKLRLTCLQQDFMKAQEVYNRTKPLYEQLLKEFTEVNEDITRLKNQIDVAQELLTQSQLS